MVVRTLHGAGRATPFDPSRTPGGTTDHHDPVDEHRRLECLIQGTNVGTWEWNVQTGETVFNARWAEIAGYALAELAPVSIQTWEMLVHPDDREESASLLQRHFAGELPFYDYECRMRHKDGHWVWIHDRGQVLLWTDDGKPLMMYGTHSDITERKKKDAELSHSERFLKTILGISNAMISIAPERVDGAIHDVLREMGEIEQVDRCYLFLFDENGGATMSNTHEWCAVGITPEKDNLQGIPSDMLPWWMAKLRAGETINIQEVSALPPEAVNEREILEAQAIQSLLVVPVNFQNELIGFLGFDSVREGHPWPESSITIVRMGANILASTLHRRRTELLLRENEENYRTFFDTLGDVTVVGDMEGRIIYANQASVDKLGYSHEELRGMHILDLHPVWAREEATAIFGDMLSGQRNMCPLPLACKGGTILPVETRVWIGRWSGDQCLFGICKDLSKEQEALQKFDRLFRMNPALMAVSSMPERRFVDVNDAFTSTLGYTEDEVIGKTSSDLGLFADENEQARMAQLLATYGSIRDVELQLRMKDGRTRLGLFSGDIIRSQGKAFFLTVMIDIDDRKQAELKLKRTVEELESALEQIRTLRGIVPICTNCKKIRDDKGFWEQVETYVARHTEADFSHGICPDCMKKLYPYLD